MAAWDVIVVGLGSVGAAAAMALGRRGRSVLGIDAHRPPHESGSHHGETRSIRRAYLEGTVYVPMALRAWELWRRLERDSGRRLLTVTENLTIGPEGAPAVEGFLEAARSFGVPHEALSAREVTRRWPQLTPPPGFAAGLESRAGILFPERCISAMLAEAERAGVDVRTGEAVLRWAPEAGCIRVFTNRGAYEAGRLLLATGAGTPGLLEARALPLQVKSVSVFWLEPPPGGAFGPGRFPVNFWQLPAGEGEGAPAHREFYSLPAFGAGVKAAPHNDLPDWEAGADGTVDRKEEARVRAFLRTSVPSLSDRPARVGRCRYTLPPDGGFLLGPLPGCRDVFTAVLAGHGFKFAPVVGEILADGIEGRKAPFDATPFSAERFSAGTGR